MSIGSDSWESGQRTRESAWTLLERERDKRISVDVNSSRGLMSGISVGFQNALASSPTLVEVGPVYLSSQDNCVEEKQTSQQ